MKLISVATAFLLLLYLSLLSGCEVNALIERKERTLALIKPDGLMGNYTDKIKSKIVEFGFEIVQEITIQLDLEKARIFYAEHSEKSFFQSLIEYMTSGPVSAMILEKPNAISDWRALIGPTNAKTAKISHPNSIRAMCGVDSERNCVHGSDSLQSAEREISFFFREILPELDSWKHDEL